MVVRVGLVGLGTVSSGTFNILSNNFTEISQRAGIDIIVSHIGARRDHPEVDLSQSHFSGDTVKVSRDIFEVVNDPEVDIVVELIGGTTTALDIVKQAIAKGKHVVTANKALIAEFGNELAKLANDAKVVLAFEAGIAGGIPIVKALREGLAGNKIDFLAGIINGTGNFILTEMKDKGRDFADVLKEAQDLGYAEADPTFDVEGIDAAHKLTILASLAFGVPLNFDATFTEGISKVTPADLDYAAEFGYRIKHLGIARHIDNNIELRVHPTLIPESNLIAKVDGVMNAVLVNGDAVGQTLYYGAGAGAGPTGSAVVADIIDIARCSSPDQAVPMLGFAYDAVMQKSEGLKFAAIDTIETAYYLRVQVEEKPGVLAEISKCLSDQGISIEGVYQKEVQAGETSVPVIIISKKIIEAKMNAAIENIQALDCSEGDVVKIRIETFK